MRECGFDGGEVLDFPNPAGPETVHEAMQRIARTQMDDVDVAAALRLTGERMLAFFEYQHLPPALQETSKWFAELAVKVVNGIAQNPERTVALRKLLEAKDCAVRARL